MDTKEFTTLITQELLKIIKNKNSSYSYYLYNGFDKKDDLTDQEILDRLVLNADGVPMELMRDYFLYGDKKTIYTDKGIIKLEEYIGDEKDIETYVQRVLSITNSNHTDYFSCEGYYSSWNGIEWEDFHFVKVKPREKTIIEYIPEL